MTREEAFAELRQRGVARAVGTFSGGGDEGGVDSITLYNAHGEVLGELEEHWAPPGEPPLTAEQRDDAALFSALEEPVHSEVYMDGWWMVWGTIVWDAEDDTVTIDSKSDAEDESEPADESETETDGHGVKE